VQPLVRRLRELFAEDRLDFFGDPEEILDALADIGDPSAAEPMSEVLLDRRAYQSETFAIDMDVNWSVDIAVDALDTLGGLDLVLDAYAGALRSPDPEVRAGAARDLSTVAWSESGEDRMSAEQEARLRVLLRSVAQDKSNHEHDSGQRGLDYLDQHD
jgi:HEAT repeat protein